MVQLLRLICQSLLELNIHIYPMTCNSSVRYLPKRIVNLCTEKDFFKNVHCSFIHNIQIWK